MMPPVAPGVIVHTNMPSSVYHDDPCPADSLSSTVARAMVINGCALAGRDYQGARSKAKDTGNVLHSLILGADGRNIEIIEHDSYRTNKAKAARDEALAAGQIPVKRHDVEAFNDSADMITESLHDAGLDLYHSPNDDAYSELTILHKREMQHGPIWIRTRLDHVKFYRGGIVAYDLKTRSKSAAAHPDKVTVDIAHSGYDVQAAAYVGALAAAFPDYDGHITWYWVYAETCSPWLVSVSGMGGIYKARGLRKWNEACEMWATGVHKGIWPGYHHYDQLPEPRWVEAQEGREIR